MSRRGFDPLTYFFEDQAPGSGEVTQVADGCFWARLPMGGRLNHINVWLLRDNDGWTIVDTGLNSADVQSDWQAIFKNHLGGLPVIRVIATHLHADHTGNAGWLCRLWDCELWMSRSDFYMCKVMAADGPSDVPDDAIKFYRRAALTRPGSTDIEVGSASLVRISRRYPQATGASTTVSISILVVVNGAR